MTEEIGQTDLKRLGQGLGAIANWLTEDASRFCDNVAMEVATAILLLQNAKGGEMLGAAGGQIAFNLGSAIGAFCGGMMIAQGFGWNSVALPAAALSFLAMSALLIYGCHQRRQAY